MPDPADRQERRLAAVRALLLRDVDRIWADLFDPRDPAGSLARIGPLVAARIKAAQADGLEAALLYADAVLAAAFGRDAIGAVVPEAAVVGVDRYGRDIPTMLAGSEGQYMSRAASGMEQAAAVAAERAFQSAIAGSAVHDADRAALTGMADPARWPHPQVEGWARVAHAGACAFCVMLAGRGYAYTSKETASTARDGNRYHDRCHCSVSIGPKGERDATAEQMYQAWVEGGANTKWGKGRGARGGSPAGGSGPRLSPSDQARLNETNRDANRLMVEAKRLEKQGRTAEAAALRGRAGERRSEAQRLTDTLGARSAAPSGTGAANTPDPVFGVIPKTMGSDAALSGANPKHSSGQPQYQENCTRCVVAYEARRRGLDVEAAPLATPDITIEDLADRTFQVAPGTAAHAWTSPGSLAAAEAAVASSPVGSRHWVYVGWPPNSQRSHIFMAENRGGVAVLIDPQSGSEPYAPGSIDPGTAETLQVDHLDFAASAAQFTIKP